MATTVQFRRANTYNTSNFVGANGEITIDTDKHTVVVHDNTTVGGWPVLSATNPAIEGRVSIAGNCDVSDTISVGTTTYANATITAITGNGSIIKFTATNTFQPGWDVTITAVNPSSYNGVYKNIYAANSTTFSVANSNIDAYVSGGFAEGKSNQGLTEINVNSIVIADSVVINTHKIQVSSAFLNSSSLYVTSNVSLGNNTSNAVINVSSISFINSTSNSQLSAVDFTLGSTYANTTTVVAQTHIANTSAKIGNATANAVVNSSSISFANSTVSTAIKLPTNTQYSGTYVLLANGTWYDASSWGSTPVAAGSNTQIIFNNSGSYGAEAAFTYDSTSNILTVDGTTINSNAIAISNSTVNTAIKIPTSTQYNNPSVFLRANGSWATVPPSGPNNSIQYSSNTGVLTGNSGFTYNDSTTILSVNSISVSVINVGANVSTNTTAIALGNSTVNSTFSGAVSNVAALQVKSNTALTLGSSSKSANGYTWLPNGLLMQWGKVTGANNSSGGNINFPTTFPTALYSIQFTTNTGTWNSTYTPQLIASNTTTANVRIGNTISTTVYYMAIGS